MRKIIFLIFAICSFNSQAFDFTNCKNWVKENENAVGYALKIQNIGKAITANLRSIQDEKGEDIQITRNILLLSSAFASSLHRQLLYLAVVMEQSSSAKISSLWQDMMNENISNTFTNIKQIVGYLNGVIPSVQSNSNARELIRLRDLLEEVSMRTTSCL